MQSMIRRSSRTILTDRLRALSVVLDGLLPTYVEVEFRASERTFNVGMEMTSPLVFGTNLDIKSVFDNVIFDDN